VTKLPTTQPATTPKIEVNIPQIIALPQIEETPATPPGVRHAPIPTPGSSAQLFFPQIKEKGAVPELGNRVSGRSPTAQLVFFPQIKKNQGARPLPFAL